MKTLIVEDEVMAANRLKGLLSKSEYNFEVMAVCDSVRETVKWLNHSMTPEIIFLDIQLSDGHAFEIFEQVALNCPIVFTTAFDEYAVKAFEVNSINYLLKPFQLKEIDQSVLKLKNLTQGIIQNQLNPQTLNMLANRLEKSYKSRFFVKSRNKAYSIPTQDISIFRYEDGAVLLYNNIGKKYLIRYSLDELQKLLDPMLFFRISRKHIININYIQQINSISNGQLAATLNKEHFPDPFLVSKHRVSQFRDWLDR